VAAPADHSERRSIRILGVRVDCLDMAQAVAEVERMIEAGGPTRLVATINPEFVMRARSDPCFRSVLEGAALCLADGAGVVWAMRRQGCPQPGRVTGSDLVPALATVCARRGWRPFLLGAQPGVAAEAARRLEASVPGLQVAGTHAGSPRPEDDEEALARIAAAHPELLLVAYGAPQQELWIARNRHRLGVPVAIGVGGCFDFLAGRVRRAPRQLQRLGLEWLWRLMLQPWRWRRMAVLPTYVVAVWRSGHQEA
jgi:N-acetylglucosaminyldiphosphoundecaprenol N-acetyl-beta-D-mannosaminyltransferase